MTDDTGMTIFLALFLIPVGLFAWAARQYLAQDRDMREREARDERRQRETAVEQAIARRRRGGERAGPAETPDAADG